MTDHTAPTPIVVPASALPAQVTSGIRSALVAAGAYAVGKGWIDESTAGAIVTVGLVIVPLVWSQLSARRNHARQVTMASQLPNRVAQVK